MGIELRVSPASISEDVLPAERPADFLRRIVRSKLDAVLRQGSDMPRAAVLVADTIVVIDGEILGKPTDVEDNVRLVGRIAGRQHTVYTRYAIAVAGSESSPHERTVCTDVWMRAASPDELSRYAATGEGADKAGGYALQGIGAFLVERIAGSHSNVIGLPACEVVSDLASLGVLGPFP